jgi:hypothetical protein
MDARVGVDATAFVLTGIKKSEEEVSKTSATEVFLFRYA